MFIFIFTFIEWIIFPIFRVLLPLLILFIFGPKHGDQDFEVLILFWLPFSVIFSEYISYKIICEYQKIDLNIFINSLYKINKNIYFGLKNFKETHVNFQNIFLLFLFILMLCTIFYFGFYIQP